MTQAFDDKATTWDDDPMRVSRAAEVASQILEVIAPSRDMHLLDFGSGTGLLGFALLPYVARVTFADPSEGMLARVVAKLRERGETTGSVYRLDASALTLPERYDAIVSLMTLHHVPDTAAVVRLLAERLRPGGWLALCDLDLEDGSFHDHPSDEVHHGFDRAELVALTEQAGLEQSRVSTAFTIQKERGDAVREYPLFLLTARRLQDA
ncbi:MAG: methyltransferase domain-containing protein [Gemmatimonadaceae bacterium]|nr:methyltransferase domain-containing protein [Gemmatimonadaceae bacterium]